MTYCDFKRGMEIERNSKLQENYRYIDTSRDQFSDNYLFLFNYTLGIAICHIDTTAEEALVSDAVYPKNTPCI